MKINLNKILALVFAGALIFTGCQVNPGSENNNSGNNQNTENETSDNGSTDDNDTSDEGSYAQTGKFEPADTSVKMAENMAIGWNLGNAFDASSCDAWAYSEGLKLEYSWLPQGANSKTTKKLIKAVRKAGFKTIRIPVSWHNHMDKNTTTYKIDDAWMARVKEVVDWSLAEGMCVIVNIHHDNLTDTEIKSNPGFCLSKDTAVQTKSKAYVEAVWKQIAETFKDYDNNLVFELLNEPRCIGTNYEWGFYTNAADAKPWNEIITAYEQVGLDAIRATGGKNATRFVMAPGYAASPSCLTGYSLPADTAKDRLILATHAYTPSDFCLEGSKTDYDKNKSYIESAIDGVFNDLSKNYVKKGTGVVMGEASASDKNNLSSRIKWTNYYFGKAKAAGIPIVLWDNEVVAKNSSDIGGENHGYFDRYTCKQTCSEVLEAMMKVVYGDDAVNAGDDTGDDEPETPADTSKNGVLFEGTYELSWDGDKKVFEASKFSNATSTTKLVFTTKPLDKTPEYVNVKLQAGDWSKDNIFTAGTVTGATKGDGVLELTASTTGFSYTPAAAEWEVIKAKGLVVFGYGTIVTKIVLE